MSCLLVLQIQIPVKQKPVKCNKAQSCLEAQNYLLCKFAIAARELIGTQKMSQTQQQRP